MTPPKVVTEKRWGVLGADGRVFAVSTRGQNLNDFRNEHEAGDSGKLMHRSWFVRVTLTYPLPRRAK